MRRALGPSTALGPWLDATSKQVWTLFRESLPCSCSNTGMCGRGLPAIRGTGAEAGVTGSDPWLGELGTPVLSEWMPSCSLALRVYRPLRHVFQGQVTPRGCSQYLRPTS